MHPNKLLGQHFLIGKEPIKTMIGAAKNESAVDAVLEIGPGKGVLTKALAHVFKKVIAVEKDGRLAASLMRALELEGIKNVEVITGDILNTDFQKLIGKRSYAVIANIPYYLTGRLMRLLLEAKRRPSYIILMVQKEVAERILSKPPQMNLLALSVQAFGKPEILARVSRKEFAPNPKVDSAIIKISSISDKFFKERRISEQKFFTIIRAGFAQKRKKLSNNLGTFFGNKKGAEEKIKKADLPYNIRPQELSLEEWNKLLSV